jgi:hypothetical protein
LESISLDTTFVLPGTTIWLTTNSVNDYFEREQKYNDSFYLMTSQYFRYFWLKITYDMIGQERSRVEKQTKIIAYPYYILALATWKPLTVTRIDRISISQML